VLPVLELPIPRRVGSKDIAAPFTVAGCESPLSFHRMSLTSMSFSLFFSAGASGVDVAPSLTARKMEKEFPSPLRSKLLSVKALFRFVAFCRANLGVGGAEFRLLKTPPLMVVSSFPQTGFSLAASVFLLFPL